MKYFPVTKPVCECPADVTMMSTVIPSVRRGKKTRSQIVKHYRQADDAYFWHWRDTTDLRHILRDEPPEEL